MKGSRKRKKDNPFLKQLMRNIQSAIEKSQLKGISMFSEKRRQIGQDLNDRVATTQTLLAAGNKENLHYLPEQNFSYYQNRMTNRRGMKRGFSHALWLKSTLVEVLAFPCFQVLKKETTESDLGSIGMWQSLSRNIKKVRFATWSKAKQNPANFK